MPRPSSPSRSKIALPKGPRDIDQELARLARLLTKSEAAEKQAADNPYRSSFLGFMQDCCWTVDKARAGEERPWPRGPQWDPYWEDYEAAVLCCSPLLIDKVRRTMVSNGSCAFDLWIASGGVDARWPSLLRSSRNRSVLIQAQKMGKTERDEGCAAEFVNRIKEMVRVMEAHGLREKWPTFPKWEWGFGVGWNDQGGKILAIPEGPDQVRGPGTTLLHMEECGSWENAQATLEVALPSLHPEGHIIAITTPAVGSYVQRIRNGEIF